MKMPRWVLRMKITPRSSLMAMSRRPKTKRMTARLESDKDDDGDDEVDEHGTGTQDVMGPVSGDDGET
jgi:hypothetical protein